MVTVQSLANSARTEDVAKIYCLYSAGGKALVHLATVTSVDWTNCVVRLCDTVVSQLIKDISLEDKRDMCNRLSWYPIQARDWTLLFTILQ